MKKIIIMHVVAKPTSVLHYIFMNMSLQNQTKSNWCIKQYLQHICNFPIITLCQPLLPPK